MGGGGDKNKDGRGPEGSGAECGHQKSPGALASADGSAMGGVTSSGTRIGLIATSGTDTGLSARDSDSFHASSGMSRTARTSATSGSGRGATAATAGVDVACTGGVRRRSRRGAAGSPLATRSGATGTGAICGAGCADGVVTTAGVAGRRSTIAVGAGACGCHGTRLTSTITPAVAVAAKPHPQADARRASDRAASARRNDAATVSSLTAVSAATTASTAVSRSGRG